MIDLADDEVAAAAKVLEYPTNLFYQEDAIRGFGTCCLYHRKRATTPVRTLNQLHDTINIRRIQIGRSSCGVSLPNEPNFPALDIDVYKDPAHVTQMPRSMAIAARSN